jgi:hypothetical protein
VKLILLQTAVGSINHLAYHLPPDMVIGVVLAVDVDVVVDSTSGKII